MSQTARAGEERLLPVNIEAECSVLGSIIIDPEALILVSDFLHAEDFYRDAHRTIYEVMFELAKRPVPADFITICDVLERRSKLEDVGGASYITSLINQVPTSGNAVFYARIVERTAILRRLIGAAGQIAALAYEAEDDAAVVVERAEQLIFEISQRSLSLGTDVSLAELLTSYMERLDQLSERRGSIVGVPTGFADLDRLTGGLRRSDLIVLAARPSLGKCLTASTLIDDPRTGERLTIEECVRHRLPTVYGVSEEGKVRPAHVADWVDSGIQPCYRVQTKTGRMVEVTGHHPFLTVHGWRPLHDLQVGQYIAVPTKVACFGNDESLPLEKVRLLAYFVAEGGLTNHLPRFTNTDPEIVEDFKKIIATHFPVCSIKQYGIDYDVAQPRNAETMRGGSILPKNPVTLWLAELGLMRKLAKDKFFPACVWQWSRRYLAEFLRVLMSCDGSIYSCHGRPVIEISIASPQLAADVHHAFVRFGIVSKLHKKTTTCQGKTFDAWRVEITNPESIRIYQEEIGWIGEKCARFAGYERKVLKEDGGNKGHAPQETWELVRDATRRQGLSLTELARRGGETTRRGRYAGYNPHSNRNIPRYRLAAYAEVLDDPRLRWIASPDVYWDEIVSIEAIGEHQVYDLSVPDGANFVAQDVFVHNTSLALSLAHNAALQYGQRIGVFSLEMSQEQLTERLMAMDTGINLQRLSTGNIEEHEWDLVVHALDRLSGAQIRIDGTSVLSPIQMRSRARRWIVEHGLDLIIVDYLQLLQPGDLTSRRKMENRVLVIDEITRNLKLLARELNIPILVLAQLSRAVENRLSKVPQLSDLRESGCLTGETLIYLPDEGQYRRLDTLADHQGFHVLALNTGTWKLERRPVIKVFSTGYKPVYKMTTRLGRSIRATANHQFLTFDGWKRLDEIACRTRLALPRMLPGAQISTMTHDELALLGHLIGDGCTLARQTMHYTTVDLDLAEEVARLATAVFETKIAPQIQWQTPRNGKGGWYQVYLASSYRLTHGVHNPIAAWLRNMGVFGLRSHQKYVPCSVFAQPIEGITCFLRHLWSTDGHAALSNERSGKSQPSIYYATSSERLAKDVQSLLLRLGINARVSRISQGVKGRDQYHVHVSGRPDVYLFIDQVGTVGKRKRDTLDQIRLHINDRVANTNRDVLPSQVWRQIAVPSMAAIGMTSRQMQAALGNAYCGTGLYKQGLSRDRAMRLASVVQSAELALLAQSDVYWDEVISIESDGVEEVYDLTVDGLHNFVANNMVVHNSIEQNADIVLFIYRDEVYNPNTERRGLADILLAKHRNGPTGTFCLRFEPQTTRFRDPTDEVVVPLAPLEEPEIEMDEREDD